MTDKKRLEDIKFTLSLRETFYETEQEAKAIEWLIEQAEQVHALKCELGRLKTNAKNKERARRRKDNYINRMNNEINTLNNVMKKRNKQLDLARDTLDFYADEYNYSQDPENPILNDSGDKARQTLEELK